MLRFLAAFLALFPNLTFAADSLDQESEVDRAYELGMSCSPSGLHQLFALAASGAITGAHTTEALSEAKEDAFFKCPESFLRQLKSESEEIQVAFDGYFGVMHSREELAEALKPFLASQEFGDFVRRRFHWYLSDG